MTIAIAMKGTLIKEPVQRQSKGGRGYVMLTIYVDDQFPAWRVFSWAAEDAPRLLNLHHGNVVRVSGKLFTLGPDRKLCVNAKIVEIPSKIRDVTPAEQPEQQLALPPPAEKKRRSNRRTRARDRKRQRKLQEQAKQQQPITHAPERKSAKQMAAEDAKRRALIDRQFASKRKDTHETVDATGELLPDF